MNCLNNGNMSPNVDSIELTVYFKWCLSTFLHLKHL